MSNILAFETIVQLIVWHNELQGQISDGNWENSRPHDHYLPWCDAEVIVDPSNPGRDFYAQKQNYNFTAPELLEVVGDRIRYTIALAKLVPEACKAIREAGERLPESDVEWNEKEHEYEVKRIAAWESVGLPKSVEMVSVKEMRAVLTRMKQIIKMTRSVKV